MGKGIGKQNGLVPLEFASGSHLGREAGCDPLELGGTEGAFFYRRFVQILIDIRPLNDPEAVGENPGGDPRDFIPPDLEDRFLLLETSEGIQLSTEGDFLSKGCKCQEV